MAYAQNFPDTSVPGFQKAVRVVGQGLEALGGMEKIKGIRHLYLAYHGEKMMDGQSRSFSGTPDYLAAGQTNSFDFVRGRIMIENYDQYLGGYVFHMRQVYADTAAFSYEVSGTRFSGITELPLNGKDGVRNTLLRQLPVFVVKAAYEKKQALRYLGKVNIDGKEMERVCFSYSAGLLLDLYFDVNTKLLDRYSYFSDHPVHGDHQVTYEFPVYQSEGGIQFPTQRIVKNNGRVVRNDTLKKLLINHEQPALYEKPVGYGKAPPTVRQLRQLAPHIFMVEGLYGYNPLFVEFSEFIVLVEPVAGTDELIQIINEKFPAKPIRYAVATHHHEDHAGGLPWVLKKGCTVLATKETKLFAGSLNAASHSLLPGNGVADTLLRFRHIEKMMEIEDGELQMQIYNTGPNSHAAEMLVVYFPKEKLLYQADLLISSDRGMLIEPLLPVNVELYDFIKKMRLDAATIIGAHWKEIPFTVLENAVLAERNRGIKSRINKNAATAF